ncbi:hypothetical protein [Pseudooctadecabacter sp.]|uniref:hypothetical protein n=1 Tax=Pseudooctadecabacter sp. TaxID=1966338 RepID=UPI0035C8368A
MRWAVLAGLVAAQPAWADEGLTDFLGGQGCTIGAESSAAARDAGFTSAQILALAEAALASGNAARHGNYVVLDADICTIGLPQIPSRYTVDTPDIRAASPYIREVYDLGGTETVDEGCFLGGGSDLFRSLEGGDPKAGFEAYMAFIGSGLIAGDLRFYEISPLKTPAGFQIMTGEACAAVANADDIARSHAFIDSGFADYVRFVGANTPCGENVTFQATQYIAQMQGFDFDRDLLDQPRINAWLALEFDFITRAAGWYEGMTDTDRGAPRPPLCHVPS